jgi:VIT1/CCC1 family predicted Fe2+/Mn2+ transporter
MPDIRSRSMVARYLDPGSRMGEALFGLIMTLTFTLGAGMVIQEEGREGAREMLIGILGCNLAWGIIDGVLYVLGQVFERGRLRRIGVAVRQAVSEADARHAIAAELEEPFSNLLDDDARHRLYQAVAERVRREPPLADKVRREDVLGGLAAGLIVFACSFPALLPFLVLDDLHFALRISNAILLGLLFFVGWSAARHTMARPWVAGLVFLLLGTLLVAMAIPLGG